LYAESSDFMALYELVFNFNFNFAWQRNVASKERERADTSTG